MRVLGIMLTLAIVPLGSGSALAQDAAAVDSRHYRVELENESVRVLKVSIAPGEKSPMHQHPAYVAVFLTDGKLRFSLPGGKTAEHEVKKGTAAFAAAESHGPENIGSAQFELFVIELKGPQSKTSEGLPNDELQRTRPAQAIEPRR
jgi:quercetin dioxygenase-like cupin family protein